jgi:hypothetical protein
MLLLVACAASGPAPRPEFAQVWRRFLELPEERALAVAGDLRRNPWVAGISGGRATREEAEEAALAACHERRTLRRIQDACQLYASGDEIVWRGP